MMFTPEACPVHHLPESLHEVVEVIGLAATLNIVEHWGGLIQLYIPRTISPDHIIAKRLGTGAAEKLAERWGGDYLRNIPRCLSAIRAARDLEIVSRLRQGESAANLALEYGLTERWIWEIKSQAKEQLIARQNLLF